MLFINYSAYVLVAVPLSNPSLLARAAPRRRLNFSLVSSCTSRRPFQRNDFLETCSKIPIADKVYDSFVQIQLQSLPEVLFVENSVAVFLS
jgi:hypothetical protein